MYNTSNNRTGNARASVPVHRENPIDEIMLSDSPRQPQHRMTHPHMLHETRNAPPPPKPGADTLSLDSILLLADSSDDFSPREGQQRNYNSTSQLPPSHNLRKTAPASALAHTNSDNGVYASLDKPFNEQGYNNTKTPYYALEMTHAVNQRGTPTFIATSNPGHHHAGCCLQLWVTIKRMVLLKGREPVSWFVEFLIPILFIVGTIILWVIFGNSTDPSAEYYSADGVNQSTEYYASFSALSCYNEAPIGSLQSCTSVVNNILFANMTCAVPRSGAPSGFCYSPMALMRLYGATSVVSGVTTTIPKFDNLVVMQWIARDAYERSGIKSGLSDVLDSVLSSGALYFAPDTADTQALVKSLNTSFSLFRYVYKGTLASEAEADARVISNADASVNMPNWGIIVVNDLSANDYDVVIRLNSSAVPRTLFTTNQYYLGGLEGGSATLYIASGFLTLQKAISDYYFTNVVSVTVPTDAAMTPMPTAAYDTQAFLAYAYTLAPLIVVLGYLYPVSQMTKRIVVEKELKLREAMLIMGLTETPIYLSLFIVYFVQYLICSIIITILLKVTYLTKSNFGVIFFAFLFYSISTIALSGMMSSFFSKARLSALLSPLIYFVFAIPLFAMMSVGDSVKYGIALLSPSGFAVGMGLIFQHELSGGMSGKDITYFRDKPNMLYIYCILVVDTIIYLLLMLYLDAVLPKDWGTPKHPLFFILDPIKCCCGRNNAGEDDNVEDGRAKDGVFEEIPDNGRTAVRIVGLRKKFKRGSHSFMAVDNLHLALREGDISVLLGHNGAGKSTTMNMMTGMLEPDAGDCYIYGRSVRHDLAGARQEIGFCPQHNILWPELTCREHLDYYAAIKGLGGKELSASVRDVLQEVDLLDKIDYHSSALSGGQKRKLSVAIAFVGGSRLVFLDEPTAGMDVGARRHTWELLQRMAETHTILLTTHYMDEADLLGSVIAIMSQGRLKCSGSSLFLKSRLGVGYLMTMSVDPHKSRASFDKFVRSHVVDAESVGSGAGEVAYRLPLARKNVFPSLLGAVEQNGEALGIRGYSLSATTLEEIFLKVAEDDVDVKEEEQAAEAQANARVSVWDVELLRSEGAVMGSQFKAMMAKRLWNALRDRRTQCFQIVCPVVCVLLAMLFTLVKVFQSPDLVLSNSAYKVGTEIDVLGCDAVFPAGVSFGGGAQTTFPSGLSPNSSQPMSDYLLKTYSSHALERYGAYVCTDPALGGLHSIFYNSSSYPEAAIGLANMYNALLQKALGNGDAHMKTTLRTMPKTDREQALSNSMYALMIGVIVMIPFTFIPSTFVGWIVKERQCKARHLQNVSGVRFSVYWLSNLLFDICSYIITIALVIIIFLIFQRKEYIGRENVGATIVLMLLYGLSGISMAYAVSFLFNDYSNAQNVVMLANFITGFLLALAVSFLILNESTKDVAKILRWIFRIIPSYCIGEGIINLGIKELMNAFGRKQSAWDMDIIGWVCVYMAAEIPFFFLITLFIDHPSRRQRSQRLFHNPDAKPEVIEDEDADVVEERTAVLTDEARKGDLVRVTHMRKQYANGKVAVRDVTFGVMPGEVFGFLGTNGAGKTTTISILCQEFYPTSGRASICGYDIVKNSREALQCVGYCPQFDATLDLLTVEEHLYLYAGVRGIANAQRDKVVKGLMALCELTNYRKTLSHELSGGNRRKLSVAISLIGGPRVVFLDEPSAGMDPVARRGLWTAIQTISDNCSVVLTTHHLEEVEALAHRVAIMVDGTLRCIGDKTHLKKKFGSGFEVNVRVAQEDKMAVQKLEDFFTAHFPAATLNEARGGKFVYALPGDTRLSETFAALEANKERLGIRDYSVSQTSIEQVFLRISHEADIAAELQAAIEAEELEKKNSNCCGCCY